MGSSSTGLAFVSVLALIACSSSPGAGPPANDGGPDATLDASVDAPEPRDAVAEGGEDAPLGEAGIGGCSTSADSGNFPSFADACTTNSQCVLVLHQVDCCGSMVAMGINVNARNDFDRDEQTWRGSCPACGCTPRPTTAQDGNAGDFTSIRVTCAGAASGSGVCRTYVHM